MTGLEMQDMATTLCFRTDQSCLIIAFTYFSTLFKPDTWPGPGDGTAGPGDGCRGAGHGDHTIFKYVQK